MDTEKRQDFILVEKFKSKLGTIVVGKKSTKIIGKSIGQVCFAEIYQNPTNFEIMKDISANAVIDNKVTPVSSLNDLYQKVFGKQPNEVSSKDFSLSGTPFQVQVWKALLKIPMGKTACYHDIAKKIGKPKANRAVGTAVGANKIAIFVPCHRVIKADGKIGNYKWGSELKSKLLNQEQA